MATVMYEDEVTFDSNGLHSLTVLVHEQRESLLLDGDAEPESYVTFHFELQAVCTHKE